MAKKLQIEWNNQGFRDVLTSEGAYSVCMKAAEEIASRAGDGFTASRGWKSKVRAHVFVNADTYEAKLEQAENDTLSKAVG